MSDNKNQISVVIPAYNEEGSIAETVKLCLKTLDKMGISNHEVIVVDDGSSDQTAERAREQSARIISLPGNKGYGRALKEGIKAAKFDTIVITDADGTYPVEKIPVLFSEYQKGFNMVVGKRTGNHYRGSIQKYAFRKILRFFVEFSSGETIPDINSGFRIFSKKEVTNYFPRLCETFSFSTSMTLAYLMTGKFISYFDIDYHQRSGNSKVRHFRDSLRTTQYIIFAILYYNPIKIFILFSSVLIGLSGSGFLFSMFTGLNIGYILGVIGVSLSLIVFSLGLLAEQLRQIMQNKEAD